MALNVFNVLNTDGYNVTKQQFEEACEKLHDGICSLIGQFEAIDRNPNRDPRSPDKVSAPVSVFRGYRPGARDRGLKRAFGGDSVRDRLDAEKKNRAR